MSYRNRGCVSSRVLGSDGECVAGDNGVRGRDLRARHRVAARGEHVRGPAAVGGAAPRGLPHALLRAHAAPAEGHGGARR